MMCQCQVIMHAMLACFHLLSRQISKSWIIQLGFMIWSMRLMLLLVVVVVVLLVVGFVCDVSKG
jgi:hypothetical protein